LAWLLIALIIYFWENYASDNSAKFYGSFVQLCFSSWPWQLSFDRHSRWFALGVSSRLVLVLGSFGGIVGIFAAMIRERKFIMKYIELIRLRDQAIEDRLLSLLPVPDTEKDQYRRFFEEAVREATQDLRRDLELLVGNDQAEILIKATERTISKAA
jgi:hypothetical protein